MRLPCDKTKLAKCHYDKDRPDKHNERLTYLKTDLEGFSSFEGDLMTEKVLHECGKLDRVDKDDDDGHGDVHDLEFAPNSMLAMPVLALGFAANCELSFEDFLQDKRAE